MENTWRLQPARQVEELIEALCPGTYPPDLRQLKFAVSFRLRYTISEVPADILVGAITDHSRRVILLPKVAEERQREMLLHEISEIYLRLPCAPEYHYQPEDNGDEFHRVSTLVHRRARRKADKRTI